VKGQTSDEEAGEAAAVVVEGCRSEVERTKRSFVGAPYTAELY